MIVRRLIAVMFALLLAVQVVRNGAVGSLATLRPAEAARFWAGHPSVEISLGLAEIGRTARERRPIGEPIFAMINDAAVKSPLAPEPYLVRGVEAQTSATAEVATRAFLAAQWRDPRSLPAAYFLAEYYFRAGQPMEGLAQTALLARLSPRGREAVAPFVAIYARDPSNWQRIRSLFNSQEGLQDSVLVALARDPANVDAILALADANHRKPDSIWLRVLLNGLIANGDYARAKAIWLSIGGGNRGAGLLYDANFSAPEPPPPFNWSLTSSTVGLAERQPSSRLHVIFYGNEDGVLASQLVVLPPGVYRLQFQLVDSPVHEESLRWSIRCDKSREPLANIRIDEAAKRGWTFQVPANCPAQWLELLGRSGDVAQQSDVTITSLSLTRAGPNA